MKKIYYVPGLISAILIPLLFWYYISPYIDKTNYNVIDVGLPAKLTKENYSYSFEPYRNWDYLQITVPPARAKENSKFYVSKLYQLKKRNEKESGIEFILTDKNTYGDIVSLLNDMSIAKQEQYAIDIEKTGHIFAGHQYIPSDTSQASIECLLCNDSISDFEEPEVKNYISDFVDRKFNRELFENISKLPKGAFIIMFGFLLLLNISMFSIKERLQL